MSDRIGAFAQPGGITIDQLTRELVSACRSGCSFGGLLLRTEQLTQLDPLQAADLACRLLARVLCQARQAGPQALAQA